MKKNYIFKRGGWKRSDFRYVYSPICSSFQEFVQEENCIANRMDGASARYDYVSIITKEKYAVGAAITAHCSFEKYGAPLIVLADDVHTAERGVLRYGHHIEVVAYEGGVNVWRLIPEGDTVHPVNLIRRKFEVRAGKIISLAVKTAKDRLLVSLGGTCFEIGLDCLPQRFYAGVTACEGIDRFYDFTVEA